MEAAARRTRAAAIGVVLGCAVALAGCFGSDTHTRSSRPAAKRTGLSPDARARALLAKMSLEGKIQLVHGTGVCGSGPGAERSRQGAGYVPGIARLDIPDINYTDGAVGVTDCGDRPDGQSTMLPSPLARASSWDPQVTAQAGALLGREARAQGFDGLLGGVSDLIRDPHWGRAFETLGEDPVLNGTLIAAELRAVQQQHVIATIKHYATNTQETARHTYSADADERTLRELHLLPYEIAIPRSGVGNVMCAYNRVNGTHACQNRSLLTTVLKRGWGFKGQVQSDWGATHSTVASALAGLDEEFEGRYFGPALKAAVESGRVPRSRLDDMVERKLRTLIATGVYDDPPGKPHGIDVRAGARAAEQIARKSMVLLRNRHGLLPLSRRTRSIAVIGSHADVGVLSGGGSSQVTPPGGSAVPCGTGGPGETPCPIWAKSSPLTAIKAAAPGAEVRFADGIDAARAAALARSSDVAIVFASEWRAEARDRDALGLPRLRPPEWPRTIDQAALISRVAGAQARTVVVLENGGPITMPWLDRTAAVLEAWYPGSQGAQAIAATLFGDNNPSGKLTVTFPKRATDVPTGPAAPTKAKHVRYTERLLVGYRWYDAKRIEPLFPFGFGLSYTTYRYTGLRLSRDTSSGAMRVSFSVRNTGRRAGEETAQVYLGLPGRAKEPPRRLAGWARVALGPGRSKRVTVTVSRKRLAIWDARAHDWTITPGRYRVEVGASSRDIRLARGASAP